MMNLFIYTLIYLHRKVRTDYQQVDDSRIVFQVSSRNQQLGKHSTNHIVVFLTGTWMFPENTGKLLGFL